MRTRMSNGPEKRKHRRLKISAEAHMTLLIPNQTFSPFTIRGIGTDISLSGICIKSYQLSKPDYLSLIRGMSHVKVSLFLPIFDEPIQLRGQVVWADFHDSKGVNDKAFCQLGISYYEFTLEAKQDLVEVFEAMNVYLQENSMGEAFQGVDLKKKDK